MQLAEKYGIRVERYPNKVVARKGSIEVLGEIEGNGIKIVVKGLGPVIESSIQPHNQHLIQRISVAPLPPIIAKHAIDPSKFMQKIPCFLLCIVVFVAIAIVLIIAGIYYTPVLLLAILVLLLAPIVCWILCEVIS